MWGPFAELFHIPPYEFDRLTYSQFCVLEQRAQQLLTRESDG
jgi:hypothetical protein